MLYVCFGYLFNRFTRSNGLYCKKEKRKKKFGKMTQICPHEIVASKPFSKVVSFPSNEIIIIILKRLTFKFLTTIFII